MKILSKNKSVFGVFLALATLVSSSCEHEGATIPVVDEPVMNSYSPKTGKPNTLITISGQDFGTFDRAIDLTIGGVEVTELVALSEEEIQVRVPYGVTEDDGEIILNYFNFTKTFGDDEFSILPGAVVDSISPSIGTIGDIVSIHGENFGTVANDVTVYFAGADGDVAASVVSVSDEEIIVEVPAALSGPVIVNVDPEVLITAPFTFPFTGIDVRFDEEDGGWTAQQDATQSVVDGELNVDFVGTQADLVNTTQVIDAIAFPIVAIRMTRLGDFDLEIETDLGTFTGEMGIVASSADVFYWDLSSAAFSDGTTLEGVQVFDEFRFNITKASAESSYKVDFIKSFATVDVMKDELADGLYPVGKTLIEFDFNTAATSPNWSLDDLIGLEGMDHRNSGFRQVDGTFYSTFESARIGFWISWRTSKLTLVQSYPEGYAEYLAELAAINNSVIESPVPGDVGGGTYEVPLFAYSTEYPIWAIKADFQGNLPALALRCSDPAASWMLGLPAVTLATTPTGSVLSGHDNVLYYDGTTFIETHADWAAANVDGVVYNDDLGFNLPGATLAVPGTEYSVDWVASFRSIEELQAYADGHDL